MLADDARASTTSRATLLAIGGLVALGFVEHVTGSHIHIYPLHFIPICWGAWVIGRRAAAGLSVLSTGLWVGWKLAEGAVPGAVLALNASIRLLANVAVALLVTRQRADRDREHELSRLDVLTDLANRRAFRERAGLELERSRRSGAPVTIVYLDVDDFKSLNDRGGHDAGDAALRRLADGLKAAVRPWDLVARMGGDEFAVLLTGTDAAAARTVVDRLTERLGAASGAGARFSTSMGVVTFVRSASTLEEMLAEADRQMYLAKARGKGCATFGVCA